MASPDVSRRLDRTIPHVRGRMDAHSRMDVQWRNNKGMKERWRQGRSLPPYWSVSPLWNALWQAGLRAPELVSIVTTVRSISWVRIHPCVQGLHRDIKFKRKLHNYLFVVDVNLLRYCLHSHVFAQQTVTQNKNPKFVPFVFPYHSPWFGAGYSGSGCWTSIPFMLQWNISL